MSQNEEKIFQEALIAVQNGENKRAKDLLTRLLRLNQKNADYWLWMSAVVDNLKEQRYCLNQVLQLDPQNKMARQGLAILGDLPPDENGIIPFDSQKRNWKMPDLPGLEENKVRLPVAKMVAALVAFIVVVALIITALNSTRLWLFRNRNVAQLGTAQPTPTFPLVNTATQTPTPDYEGPPPPWAAINATYTPTPVYVYTPHPIIEAYSIALRAYQNGEWEKAIDYFEQSIESEPTFPDLPYYLGETYRSMGSIPEAESAYRQALLVDPDFAPAYVSQAILDAAQGELASAAERLNQAIKLDKNYGQAYLELAKIQIQQDQIENAEENLVLAEKYLPNSPEISIVLGQAALAQDDFRSAIRYAEQAAERDLTNLMAYRLLGEAMQANGQVKESLDPLYIYVTYNEEEDPQALAWLASAYAANNMTKQALEIFDEVIAQDKWQVEVYLQRGQIYLNQNKLDAAVDDFDMAFTIQPDSFETCMLYGMALLTAEFPGDAYEQISKCQKNADDDRQLAQMYFYRALALEALQNKVAVRDWERMLSLDETMIKPEWQATAQFYLNQHYTPTPTLTKTPRPTRTPNE
ncbi:MAG: hypothetical protein CL609_09030 [Anaerolineaceae bacterium]|nr:hypothetical protein [Anaerolineaceae bacterium]